MGAIKYNFYSLRFQTCNNKRSDAAEAKMQTSGAMREMFM